MSSNNASDDALKHRCNELQKLIFNLFERARKKEPFHTACAVLRVDGLSDANWDPFEASIRVLDALHQAGEGAEVRGDRETALMFELLAYCQALEMSAIHDLLWNLLCIADGEPYRADPWGYVARKSQGKQSSPSMGGWSPLSASERFKKIVKRARAVGHGELADSIELSFNEEIRNAVSHSDFIVHAGAVRITEGRGARVIPAHRVQESLDEAVSLFNAIFAMRNGLLLRLAELPPTEIEPGVVFTYFAGEDKRAVGFEIVGPRGICRFIRRNGGVDLVNMIPQSDGSFQIIF